MPPTETLDAADQILADAIAAVPDPDKEEEKAEGAPEAKEDDPKPEDPPEKKDEETDEEKAQREKAEKGLAEWAERNEKRRAELTKEAQELAEQRKEIEREREELAELQKQARAAAPKDEETAQGFAFNPIDLYEQDDEEDPDPDIEKANQQIGALNKVGEAVQTHNYMLAEIWRDLFNEHLQAEYQRTVAAVGETFEGIEITFEEYVDALQRSKDIDLAHPFAYREFRSWDNEKRRSIVEAKIGPKLTKAWKDKEQDKARQAAEPPKPPASVEKPVNTSTPEPEANVDYRDSAAFMAFISGTKPN
jgi:hypothetical protein